MAKNMKKLYKTVFFKPNTKLVLYYVGLIVGKTIRGFYFVKEEQIYFIFLRVYMAN